jgi:hypothetical protein
VSANLDLVRPVFADWVRRLAEALGVSLVELGRLVELEDRR